MDRAVHREMDDWFESTMGTRFRERSLFATGSIAMASLYKGSRGEVRRLRPVSEFAFCWSPKVEDLFHHHRDLGGMGVQALLTQAGYKMTDLRDAASSGCEIMLIGTFQANRLECCL